MLILIERKTTLVCMVYIKYFSIVRVENILRNEFDMIMMGMKHSSTLYQQFFLWLFECRIPAQQMITVRLILSLWE